MTYYAIKNIRTGGYISGTDFRCSPHRQILAGQYRAPKLFTDIDLQTELRRRQISPKTYKVVEVELKEAKE